MALYYWPVLQTEAKLLGLFKLNAKTNSKQKSKCKDRTQHRRYVRRRVSPYYHTPDYPLKGPFQLFRLADLNT